ncbi:MAG: carbon-nitrogen hydrolase family protein [Prolixibacteraceae bacterium]
MVRIGVVMIGILLWASLLSHGIPNGQERPMITKYSASFADDTLSKILIVASVQMHSSDNLQDNVARIKGFIKDCAAKGIHVAAFPECALTGYNENVIKKLTAEQINQAEKQVAEACRESLIYAIVGMPYRDGQKLFNSAAVISPQGKVIERYHKNQLAESWPDPGDHLSVFKIDGVLCSIIICHDERYPELVRLPVLAGAKVIFYISHESGVKEEDKINPYRAQIQARAVENTVYIVHANAPANQDATGSHGQSRIIAPDGNIIKEASIFGDEIISSIINLNKANRGNALKSLNRGPLQDWWKEGIKAVRIIQ